MFGQTCTITVMVLCFRSLQLNFRLKSLYFSGSFASMNVFAYGARVHLGFSFTWSSICKPNYDNVVLLDGDSILLMLS